MNIYQIIIDKIPVIASFSGGKDSTAMCLYLLYESGIPKEQIHIVFADTGWEHEHTYEVVECMNALHPVTVVKSEKYGGMVGLMKKRGIPTQIGRFCTSELKVLPIKQYVSQFPVSIDCRGIRIEEGTAANGRGDVQAFELDGETMQWVWYPIAQYSLVEVWEIHERYQFPRNKLYDLGFSRVGCAPCIFARKEEIRLWSDLAPSHIEEIRKAEQQRNFPFFSPTGKKKFHNCTGNNGKPYANIDAVLQWAAMSRKEVMDYEPELDCLSGFCE